MPEFTVTLSGMIHASYTRTVRAVDKDAATKKVTEMAQNAGPQRFDLDWQGDELEDAEVKEA